MNQPMNYVLGEDAGGPFIHCLECQTRSHNPNDILHRYCGYCHLFHDAVVTMPDKIIYDKDRRLPLKLYIYGADGFHDGGIWFRDIPQYPDEETTTPKAMLATGGAMDIGLEVRICNGGDFCVFHCKDGKVIYPPEGFNAFWQSLTVPS